MLGVHASLIVMCGIAIGSCMSYYCSGCVLFIHVPCLWMCILFNFSFVCLHVYAYAFKSKVHCGSTLGPGASGLPYYCTQLVCVPTVIGGPAVWRHNKRNKNQVCVTLVKWYTPPEAAVPSYNNDQRHLWIFPKQEGRERESSNESVWACYFGETNF